MAAALILSLALASMPPVASVPGVVRAPMPPFAMFPATPPPAVDAVAWMAYSASADAEIGSSNADRQLAPASITKLMTAILVVENADLDDQVTISRTAASTPIGYIGQPAVRLGEVWTVRQLLENIMVQSGNDAAVALAEHVAGSVEAFVDLMNRRAADLGMTSTVFVNPHGLDADGQVSTARDLIRLGVEALEHPAVLDAARIKAVTFALGTRRLPVTATNRDLGVYPSLLGLRTGDTLRAGQVLLAYLETPRGPIVAVVLGSQNRRNATRQVISWAAEALGPRDHFYGMAAGTAAAEAHPEWYRTRMAAAGPVLAAASSNGVRTPLLDEVDERLRELLPSVLGGSA